MTAVGQNEGAAPWPVPAPTIKNDNLYALNIATRSKNSNQENSGGLIGRVNKNTWCIFEASIICATNASYHDDTKAKRPSYPLIIRGDR